MGEKFCIASQCISQVGECIEQTIQLSPTLTVDNINFVMMKYLGAKKMDIVYLKGVKIDQCKKCFDDATLLFENVAFIIPNEKEKELINLFGNHQKWSIGDSTICKTIVVSKNYCDEQNNIVKEVILDAHIESSLTSAKIAFNNFKQETVTFMKEAIGDKDIEKHEL